jgi:DNA-binding CsgD family transcriptional regulator
VSQAQRWGAARVVGGWAAVISSVTVGDGVQDNPIESIETAVRRLVELVRSQSSSLGATSDVLLDLQVGDVRCRLEAVPARSVIPTGGALSPREAEVARMVAQGYPNKTIAAVLEISSFTVSSYLRRIFAKLGVNSRAAMVARVLEQHLLPTTFTETDSVNGSQLHIGDAR